MNSRIKAGIFCLWLVLTLSGCATTTSQTSSGDRSFNIDIQTSKIHVGMTKQQVISIIGEPTSCSETAIGQGGIIETCSYTAITITNNSIGKGGGTFVAVLATMVGAGGYADVVRLMVTYHDDVVVSVVRSPAP
jgi:hypothetical protein